MKMTFVKKQTFILLFSIISVMSAGILAFAITSQPIMPFTDGPDTGWAKNVLFGNRYTVVDESTCNGNNDFIFTNTHEQRNSFMYDFSSIPEWTTVTGISVIPCASVNQATGSHSIFNVYLNIWNGLPNTNPFASPFFSGPELGGYKLTNTIPTNLQGTRYPLSYTKLTRITTTSIISDYVEAGVVYKSGDRGIRVSRLAIQMDYDDNSPSQLFASNIIQPNFANLTWQDNSSYESEFSIERSTDNVNFQIIGVVPANNTRYTDQGSGNIGLAPGTYFYRVFANAPGNAFPSRYTNTASITVPTINQ